MKVGLAVIGSDALAAAVALFAARRRDELRAPVLLLGEPREAAAEGEWVGLRQDVLHLATSALRSDGLRWFAGLERATGRAVGFQACGAVTLVDAAELAELERRLERELAPVADVRSVGPDELARLAPALRSPEGAAAFWEAEAAVVERARVVDALAALAREAGAVTRASAGPRELVVEGGRVVALRTAGDTIEVEQVVVTDEPAGLALLERLGLRVELERYEETALVLAHDPDALPRAPSSPLGLGAGAALELDDLEERFAVEPDPEALHPLVVHAAGGWSARPEPSRPGVRLVARAGGAQRTRLLRELGALLPLHEGLEPAEVYARRRLRTADGLPAVGALPGIAGLHAALGLGAAEVVLAPALAEGLAQLLGGDPVSAFDPARLDPGRVLR